MSPSSATSAAFAAAEASPVEPLEGEQFEQVYRRHAQDVAAFALRLGVHPASVPDCVQDVFVTLHRKRQDYDPDRPLLAWIFGITRRVAFRQRRSAARSLRKRSALRWSGLSGLADHGSRSRAYVDRQEARILLEGFIEDLADRDPEVARVFVMRDLAGFSISEIVRETGLTRDAVRYRIDGARNRLRESLDDAQPVRGNASLVPTWGAIALALERGGWTHAWGLGALFGSAGSTGASAVGAVAILGALAWGVLPTTSSPPARPADDRDPSGASAGAAPVSSASDAPTEANDETTPPREPDAPDPRSQSQSIRHQAPPPTAAFVPGETPAPESPASQDQLSKELALLEQARSALETRDYASARVSLSRHRESYARGFLADGRVRLELRLACDSGHPERIAPLLDVWKLGHPGVELPPHLDPSCPKAPSAGEEEVQ